MLFRSPYFHSLTAPEIALRWTVDRFDSLSARTQKPVMFKEVGLPTAGDPRLSEQSQADYYAALSHSHVRFAWFEAFDQPWKKDLPVEPHWGLFRADRTPKPVVSKACRVNNPKR